MIIWSIFDSSLSNRASNFLKSPRFSSRCRLKSSIRESNLPRLREISVSIGRSLRIRAITPTVQVRTVPMMAITSGQLSMVYSFAGMSRFDRIVARLVQRGHRIISGTGFQVEKIGFSRSAGFGNTAGAA